MYFNNFFVLEEKVVCTTSMYINMHTYCKSALFTYNNKDASKHRQVLSSHKARYATGSTTEVQ